jgi:hypothetical protein
MRTLGVRRTVCDILNRGSLNELATGEAEEKRKVQRNFLPPSGFATDVELRTFERSRM